MKAENRDIAAFCFGLGMGLLADPQSQAAALTGVILGVVGIFWTVKSRSSGAGS